MVPVRRDNYSERATDRVQGWLEETVRKTVPHSLWSRGGEREGKRVEEGEKEERQGWKRESGREEEKRRGR